MFLRIFSSITISFFILYYGGVIHKILVGLGLSDSQRITRSMYNAGCSPSGACLCWTLLSSALQSYVV